MQEGRQVPRSEGLQRAIMEVLTGKYTPEDKLINELVRRSGVPVLRDVHSRRGTLHLSRPGIFGKNSEMALRYNPRHKSGGVQFIKRFQEGGSTTQEEMIDANNGADGTSAPPYQALMDPSAEQEKFNKLKQYLTSTLARDEERQRQDMMSDALINIGAGIASGNIGAGLEKAGASVAATRKAQRDRQQALELQLMKEMPGGVGSYADLPASAKELEYLFSLNPELRKLSPRQLQALYLDLKRQNWQVVEVGGVPTRVRVVGGAFYNEEGVSVIPDTVPTVVSGVADDKVGGPATEDAIVSVTDGVDGSAKEVVSDGEPLITYAEILRRKRQAERSAFTEEQFQQRITDAPKSIANYQGMTLRAEEIDRAIEDVFETLDRSPGAAGYGSWMKMLPASDARRLASRINTIQARLAFGELQSMRDSSKTGGALGQVSEMEIGLLKDAVVAIDQAATAEDLRVQIALVKERYEDLKKETLQRYAEMMTDPTYVNELQIQNEFKNDISEFVTDLSEGNPIRKQTALDFFEFYKNAGGVIPDTAQELIAIEEARRLEASTAEATQEQVDQLALIEAQIAEERSKK
jgi:hypothetical protein